MDNISLNIKHLRKINKLSQEDLATKLETKRHNIGAWEEGRATPSIDILIRLAKIFSITIDDLLICNLEKVKILKTENRIKGIPLIPFEAVAGFPDNDNIGITFKDCEHYIVPEFMSKGVEFLIKIDGASMYPNYIHGDIIACKRIVEKLSIRFGKVYVIDSYGGVLLKRIFIDKDNPEKYITLSSDNKEQYPAFSFLKSDIRSLSIVVGVIRLE